MHSVYDIHVQILCTILVWIAPMFDAAVAAAAAVSTTLSSIMVCKSHTHDSRKCAAYIAWFHEGSNPIVPHTT